MTGSMFSQLATALEDDWQAHARPEQLPPPGNWGVWVILAGRGWGKTRTGAEWVRSLAESSSKARIALVGATAADVRDIMVEGVSGVLSVCPDYNRPTYEPSKRRIVWPNGAIAQMFSSEEPDRLRGPQFTAAWCDELAAWRNVEETWSMLQFGLRLGRNPQQVVTTTPRPLKIIKELIARPDAVVTKGSTFDNKDNLAPSFFTSIIQKYQGTRVGRQELEAEILLDTPGTLWNLDWIDRDRLKEAPELARVIVAVDPAVSTSENADETGIIVAGIDRSGRGYVLADLSGRYQPHEWAGVAVRAYETYKADRIIAESNQGGQMVEGTIRAVAGAGVVPVKLVHASRGKVVRAEPVSALYEQRKISHVGCFAALEDQMCGFTSDFDRARMGYSPDRVDALVWAFSELIVNNAMPPIPIVAPIVVGLGTGFRDICEREFGWKR